MHDIVLTNARILDPSQDRDGPGWLAISGGKIAGLGGDEPAPEASQVFDLTGKLICPGLIDIHCHPAAGFAHLGVPADEIGLATGVTALGDAGTAGASNFEALRTLCVEPAKTDILCFLNLANSGLVFLPEIWSEQNIDLAASRRVLDEHRDVIRGMKLRAVEELAQGPGLAAVEAAKKLAAEAGLPLMLHIGQTRPRVPADPMDEFTRAAIDLLEAGDILSHYLTWEPGGLIKKDGTIYPELTAAAGRRVVLDSCHGLNHFSFTVARLALEAGFAPTVISTDMCTVNLLAAQSLAVTMSKFLNLGLELSKVIAAVTCNPARALGEQEGRGALKPGMPADITVLELLDGQFTFCDGTGGERLMGERLMEPRLVFKNGRPQPAWSGYHPPPVYEAVDRGAAG
jgi:dihydroorotase